MYVILRHGSLILGVLYVFIIDIVLVHLKYLFIWYYIRCNAFEWIKTYVVYNEGISPFFTILVDKIFNMYSLIYHGLTI